MRDNTLSTGEQSVISSAQNGGYSGHNSRVSRMQEDVPQDPERTSMFAEYLRVLARNRWLIVTLASIGLAAAILFHLTTQPVYRSRTSLDIQSVNGQFMNMGALDPTTAAMSGESMIQTQIKLLQSDSLLDRVQERLTLEPHPLTVPRMDLLSRTERLLHLPQRAPIAFSALLAESSDDFKVKPLGITRLVEVTCDSWDPAFAAKFCDALTSEFQAADLESRGADAKRTSDWLTKQAADIREKAVASQQRLVAATGNNGLLLSQQSDAVGADRLRQMQTELVKAQADRMEKEAQTAVARTASVDASPGVIADPAYAALVNKLGDLQTQVAALVPPLTEANPRVIHLRAQIAEIQDAMAHERMAGNQRLQGEYTAAKHREDLLTMAYRTEEQSVSTDLEKGSQVALLRREVESEQQLYETLLQRAKEAGFASAMQASTIRVVDAAKAPRFALYPQRFKEGFTGLLIGLLAAITWSFLRERSRVLIHLPGDSERYLQISELGVIPSPRAMPAINGAHGRKSTSLTISPDRDSVGNFTRASVLNWDQRFSLDTEAYRSTTLSLMLGTGKRGTGSFVVSSPNAGEGKTTITANLGIALAKAGVRVVLVDGDLRRPNLHTAFNLQNHMGLRDVLRGATARDVTDLRGLCQATEFANLRVMSSGVGDDNIGELAHSPRFAAMLDELAQTCDVVLVDTPPMLHIADARIFAERTKGVILVFRSGATTRDEALHAREAFDRDRTPVVGSILTGFDPHKQGKYGYYSSYYAYHSGSDIGTTVGR